LITATKSKETRNDILTWDIFKSLIPTFGILFLVSLLFIAVINSYSVFKFLIFKYSSLFTFIVYLYKYVHNIRLPSRSLILVSKWKYHHRIKCYRHLFNYACLQALVNNSAYMAKQKICVIANYNWKTYLYKLQVFVQACNLAISKLTM